MAKTVCSSNVATGNPHTSHGGLVRWENHRSKWWIFQRAMFEHVGKRNNIWDVWRNRYIYMYRDEIFLYIELEICTTCSVLLSWDLNR